MIDYLLLAKAAMLHDIGKLCYRDCATAPV